MNLQGSIVRNAPQQNLMNELRSFMKGAAIPDKCNPVDLTKTALTLLKLLPASRTAVFEYFCKVFDNTASNYILGLESEIKTGKLPHTSETDELTISEIHLVLTQLINENPSAWAPIISAWSLELLGEISTKYAGRAHISTNLNETLQLWMGCRATRTLVDINTKCLSSLIHSDTETCISALLDTSVKHSPNFDWVVAHVGSCFPNTVITRVLTCGLKDFCQNKNYEELSESPKLKSVVGILGHLAGSHTQDIRKAILDMFQWSLRETLDDTEIVRAQKKGTTPYILQLAGLSETLLSSICDNTKNILTFDTIVRLYHVVDEWYKYFASQTGLEEFIITLILHCETGGIQIISILLECCVNSDKIRANDDIKEAIQQEAQDILVLILQALDESIRNKSPFKLINSFQKDRRELKQMLLDKNTIVCETAAEILTFLGSINPSVLIESATHLLVHSDDDEQLVLLIKMLTHDLIDKTTPPYCNKGGHFSIVLEQILSRNIQKFSQTNEEQYDLTKMWKNLFTLLSWEKTGSVTQLNSHMISRAIESNLVNLTSLFGSESLHVHVIADILVTVEIPTPNSCYNPSIQVVLNLTQSTVNYFFVCTKDEGTSDKVRGFSKVCRILKRLCVYSKVAKVLALRELLERALFKSENVLFGAKNNSHHHEEEKCLLKQNKKINKTIPLTKHSSVFNGGIIGNGKRKSLTQEQRPEEMISDNVHHLIETLRACCSSENSENKITDLSLDSMTLLSLLLIQFVSPDVMYNGLPWPDEEFSKVTIERDLFIRKMFTNTPLLWDLLRFVAVSRPALCYCSVLIRALTATLIHQWKSMGEQSKANDTENYKNLMRTTVQVVELMAMGQLLPPPLSFIGNVLPFLQNFEIVAILKECVWSYMRDHIPSPALFACDPNGVYWRDPAVVRPSETYTNALRIIMQRNIKTLGSMYAEMFINVLKHE